MWVDARGVAHTAALPEPREHLAPAFLAALTAADPAMLEHVSAVLADAEDDIDAVLPNGPTGPVGEGLPAEPVLGDGYDGEAPLPDYVRDLVASTDVPWRLDVVMALTDVVDDLLDPDDDEAPSGHGADDARDADSRPSRRTVAGAWAVVTAALVGLHLALDLPLVIGVVAGAVVIGGWMGILTDLLPTSRAGADSVEPAGSHSVTVTDPGPTPIQVIKVLREASTPGPASDIMRRLSSGEAWTVAAKLGPEAAATLAAELRRAGATAEVADEGESGEGSPR